MKKESRIRSESSANSLKSVQSKRDRTGFAIPRNILDKSSLLSRMRG
jgi:hypothetical protein